LVGAAPVRRRFGFSDDDVERLREWAAASNTRWGLDALHRKAYGLSGVEQGTWRSGLDRLLLGAALEQDEQWLARTLPLDDVDSGDIDLVGRMAEMVDRVDAAIRAMEGKHSVAGWVALLEDAVLSLGEVDRGASWQQAQLRQQLADVAAAAAEASTPLGLADVTALLQAQLRGRPTRASFRTGTLTVCTLVPMRSVPHRVVCLIGLDDGAFPRQGIADGDDVLARDPRTGERDIRSEDRQLFLDAICAAQETLVIAFTGADPRTGADIPPAVPLGELLDALDLTATGPVGGRARDQVIVRHPLQPFAARNFIAGELGAAGPFSFDPLSLAGARAAAQPRQRVPALVSTPLQPQPPGDLSLDDLVRFVQHPARAFLRQRLGVAMSARGEDPDDALPVELDGLAKWEIGDRVLRRCLAGMSPASCAQQEHLRGELPPGPPGQAVMREIGSKVDRLIKACAAERTTPPQAVDIAIDVAGRRVWGTVSGVRGESVLAVTYSTLAAKHRLAAWVRHLALVAAHPETDWNSVSVGARSFGNVRRYLYADIDPATAADVLGDLVALRDAGLCEPLPMAVKTSATYAGRRAGGTEIPDALWAARKDWSFDTFGPEALEPEHALVWGLAAPLEALLHTPPAAGEQRRAPEETSRFGVLARRLWTPLLAHESDTPV